MKKTLVIGASENPERYSNKAIVMLREHNYEVLAIGNRGGKVLDVDIVTEKVQFENIDTITLYLNAKRQEDYYGYILGIKPKRVIFNPGTENSAFYKILDENGIAYEEACTLVLLSTGQY
ncbi:MAG: CoA-binding protein [Bacteroidota bacterium]|nr:CoA-binding protein [Bacteroidota bacterium]